MAQKDEWDNSSFYGVVLSKERTSDHGKFDYVIRNAGDGEITIRDAYWKMGNAQIGDFVKKEKGSENVEISGK